MKTFLKKWRNFNRIVVFVQKLSNLGYLEAEFLEVIKKPKISRSLEMDIALEFMTDWVNFALYVKPAFHINECRDPDEQAEVIAHTFGSYRHYYTRK